MQCLMHSRQKRKQRRRGTAQAAVLVGFCSLSTPVAVRCVCRSVVPPSSGFPHPLCLGFKALPRAEEGEEFGCPPSQVHLGAKNVLHLGEAHRAQVVWNGKVFPQMACGCTPVHHRCANVNMGTHRNTAVSAVHKAVLCLAQPPRVCTGLSLHHTRLSHGRHAPSTGQQRCSTNRSRSCSSTHTRNGLRRGGGTGGASSAECTSAKI